MSSIRAVSPSVFAGSDAAGRVNAGFVRTARGALVVDSLVTREDGRALAAAAEEAAGPVLAVVLTHEHLDHTVGTTDFPQCGVLASEGTAGAMAAEFARYAEELGRLGVAVREPTLVFEGRLRLRWDPEVVVEELGGHAAGSTVVWVPSEGVLFTGDLVFRGRPPWVGSWDPDLWLASLRRLERLGPAVVVPGHGTVGGPEVLAEQREWLETFVGRARELLAAGTDLAEALTRLREEFGYAEPQTPWLRLGLLRLGFALEGGTET
ncbi:MAG: MBL fold metallo-hydrolase [Firmicutes bacterium]|nr:MBL fold metallo-hydrolase [Bacillota bacterium]